MQVIRPQQPKPKLIRGHYYQFYRDQLAFLERCARGHGDLVRLRFFHVPVYLLNSPQLIEETLSTASLRKPRTLRTPPQRKVFGGGLLASDGKVWLWHRRLLQSMFTARHLNSYGRAISAAVEDFVERWVQTPKRILDEDFAELPSEVSAKIFFGVACAEERLAVQ